MRALSQDPRPRLTDSEDGQPRAPNAMQELLTRMVLEAVGRGQNLEFSARHRSGVSSVFDMLLPDCDNLYYVACTELAEASGADAVDCIIEDVLNGLDHLTYIFFDDFVHWDALPPKLTRFIAEKRLGVIAGSHAKARPLDEAHFHLRVHVDCPEHTHAAGGDHVEAVQRSALMRFADSLQQFMVNDMLTRFSHPSHVSMVETLVTLAASGRLGMTDLDHVLFMYDAEGLELPLDFVYAMGGDLLDAQTWLEGKKQRLAQAAAADAAPDTPVLQSDSQL